MPHRPKALGMKSFTLPARGYFDGVLVTWYGEGEKENKQVKKENGDDGEIYQQVPPHILQHRRGKMCGIHFLALHFRFIKSDAV